MCNRIHLDQQPSNDMWSHKEWLRNRLHHRQSRKSLIWTSPRRKKGTELSHDDIKFYQTMENGVVHFEYMHYEMPLPFKHKDLQLPNNCKREKRLNSLKKCPVSNARYYTDYCSFVSEIVSKGYAHKVGEFKGQDGRTWYLLHHTI